MLRCCLILALALALLPRPAVAAPAAQPASCVTAAAAALAQRGKPYVWGAKGPAAFDCSGLTHYAWAMAGYNIGLSTYDQALAGVEIPCRLADLAGTATTCWEPGDLVFLRYAGGQHVAMYVSDGLFADAYNGTTGVIVHDVTLDSFYAAHFWQARRITTCAASHIDPGSADSILASSPSLELIPDILTPITITVSQCGTCNADGTVILAPGTWAGTWPSGTDLLNVGMVVQTVISWLAFQIGEMFRSLICWLLNMLAILLGFLASALNMLIVGVNALFKMLVLLWLSFREWFLAMWTMAESIRELLYIAATGWQAMIASAQALIDVIALLASVLGSLIGLIGGLGLGLLGVVGWIGGLMLGLLLQIQTAITGTSIPEPLTDTHIIYYAVRGLTSGVVDSQVGWVMYLIWGMAYVAFVWWLSRFLGNKEG
jgi:hypothetical protein